MEPSWLDRHSPTTVAPTRSKVDLIKTKNPVGYSPTRSLFHRSFCNDFRCLEREVVVSSKCSPPELRSYKQNQGRGYLFRTLPEVNPKFSIPQKFSGTNPLALVGSSLVGGDYTPTGWEVKGKVWEKCCLNLC